MGEKMKDAETQRDMAQAEAAKRSRQLAEARSALAASQAEVAKLKEAVSAEMAASEQAKARPVPSLFWGWRGGRWGGDCREEEALSFTPADALHPSP